MLTLSYGFVFIEPNDFYINLQKEILEVEL